MLAVLFQQLHGLSIRDAEEPGRDARAPLKGAGALPDCKHRIADDFLRRGVLPHEPQNEVEDAPVIAAVQHLERAAVLLRDPAQQEPVLRYIQRCSFRYWSHGPRASVSGSSLCTGSPSSRSCPNARVNTGGHRPYEGCVRHLQPATAALEHDLCDRSPWLPWYSSPLP